MFTTGSKLFLGATALVDVAAVVVYGVTKSGGAAGSASSALLQLAVAFALLFGVNYYVPRRQRLGDGTRPPRARRLRRSAAAGARHVAGRRGRRRRRARRRRGHRSRSCSRPASSSLLAGARRVDGRRLERAGLGRRRRTTPGCASACSTRSSSRCSAAVGLGDRDLLVLADHAVDRQERRPGRLRRRRRADALVRRVLFASKPSLQAGRRHRRLRDRRPRPASAPAR